MNRWFKEPLLHFLVAGGLLFAVYAWLGGGGSDQPRVVRITAAEVDWLKETWARQWQRPPSETELRGLVIDYLKEGLLAREAQGLGLADNDTVVRRRLAQKMQFLLQDTVSLADPGEDELRRLYHATAEIYRIPPRISFTQIYFTSEVDARRALAQLETDSTVDLGDSSLLEREHAHVDKQAVESQFGPGFAEALFSLETGPWHGPVASGYGFHLVRVSEREDARQRPFDEVRTQVLAEWQRARQTEINEQFFEELLKKYDVVVEPSVQPLLGSLAGATP